ncbi:hypothetical protein ACHWQZ_G017837 [Mnemiopsis leidyi]
MILLFFVLTFFVQGSSCYNFNLIDAHSHTIYAPSADWGLLVVDGGTVNKDDIGLTTKHWLCRMLGYENYFSSTTFSNEWMQSLPVRYRSVRCEGDVLPQCQYQKNGTDYGNALWLWCNSRTQFGNTESFYLVDRHKEHTQKGHGLLMYNEGTVNGKNFDDNTADVVCRIMGYEGVMSWSIGLKYPFQDGKILSVNLKDLKCLTNNRAFPLCQYSTYTVGSSHEEDIWLWCDMPNPKRFICPPGQMVGVNDTCLDCPANTFSVEPNENTACTDCPTSSTSLPGATICSCPENTYMSSAGDQCLVCPRNSNSTRGSQYCTCEGGWYLYSTYSSCVQCPRGQVSRVGSMEPGDCVKCPVKSDVINDGKACSCEEGYGWEWTSDKIGSCKACPPNSYKDKQQGICVACPQEATSLHLSEHCQCPNGLSWDGKSCVDCAASSESSVCGCTAGTFWSREASQCQPCPENHFSGNFSSFCDKCPLSTVSKSQSSECTSCPKGSSWDNYVCTECPENHVGNGAICSVCPENTVPSKDKTICQKSAFSMNALPVTSVVLCTVLFVAVIGIIFFTWRDRQRAGKAYQQVTYQETVGKEGGNCRCPLCPCSVVEQTDVTIENEGVVQQVGVYAKFD